MVNQTQYFLWREETNTNLILLLAYFHNELISNRFNPAGDHTTIISHNTILIPSVSELYGLGALIFFTLSTLIILEKNLSQ